VQFYRCRCGKHTAFGSYGPYACEGCPDCNTTLEQHPDYHRVPEPHQFEDEYDVDRKTGETFVVRICQVCNRREVKDVG
jgi:hypothetical protein